MTRPDAEVTSTALVNNGTSATNHTPSLPHQKIRVSQAVLDAAMKDGDALLQSLQTSIGGLTQTEAEDRARKTGPNEVAQERQPGWFGRLLKMIRNPLVVLLTIL